MRLCFKARLQSAGMQLFVHVLLAAETEQRGPWTAHTGGWCTNRIKLYILWCGLVAFSDVTFTLLAFGGVQLCLTYFRRIRSNRNSLRIESNLFLPNHRALAGRLSLPRLTFYTSSKVQGHQAALGGCSSHNLQGAGAYCGGHTTQLIINYY